jgi:hypothetical protein
VRNVHGDGDGDIMGDARTAVPVGDVLGASVPAIVAGTRGAALKPPSLRVGNAVGSIIAGFAVLSGGAPLGPAVGPVGGPDAVPTHDPDATTGRACR